MNMHQATLSYVQVLIYRKVRKRYDMIDQRQDAFRKV